MNLTNRQTRILNLLFKNHFVYMNSDEIASRIGVTNKTVQSDINDINYFLEDYPITIDSSRGKGYKIIYDDNVGFLDVVNSLVEINKHEEFDFQCAWIICYLIYMESYVTQKELMDSLFISLTQFKDVFKNILNEIYRHQLHIESSAGQGLLMTGEEIHKRLCFVHYYRILKDSEHYHQLFIEKTKYLEFASNPVDIDIIKKEITKRGFVISKNNHEYLQEYLVFSLNRKYSKHSFSHSQIDFGLENQLSETGEIISKSIFEDDPLEAIYTTVVLKFIVNESSLVPHLQMNDKDAKIIQLVNNHFFGRKDLFERNFRSMDDLQREITNAILLIVYKNSLGYRELETEIDVFEQDDEFIVAIEYASLLTFKLENDLNIEFFNDDMFRLASIFNIHLKVDIWDEQQHIYIYSESSLVKQRYLQRKIGQLLNNVTVDIINSLAEVDNRSNTVVITNMDNVVMPENIEVAKFASLMRYNEIIMYIRNLFSPYERGIDRFLGLFDESQYTVRKFRSRNEIVEFITDKYKCSLQRKAVIQKNVYTRESRYFGTVINGTAYPRIYVDSQIDSRVEVIILKEPVLWYGQPINMVMAHVLPNTYNSLAVLGRPFNDISTNTTLISELSGTCEFNDFLLKLSNYLKTG